MGFDADTFAADSVTEFDGFFDPCRCAPTRDGKRHHGIRSALVGS
jgi:hypothetical protein